MTVLTSYLNYLLWFVALVRLDANRLAVGVSAAPIVSVVAAAWLCGDPVTRWLALGAGMILMGITLSNWDRLQTLWRERRAART
jgi:drug/metabolite transporter (DMT)-like permease